MSFGGQWFKNRVQGGFTRNTFAPQTGSPKPSIHQVWQHGHLINIGNDDIIITKIEFRAVLQKVKDKAFARGLEANLTEQGSVYADLKQDFLSVIVQRDEARHDIDQRCALALCDSARSLHSCAGAARGALTACNIAIACCWTSRRRGSCVFSNWKPSSRPCPASAGAPWR